jgi:hypothetical protein
MLTYWKMIHAPVMSSTEVGKLHTVSEVALTLEYVQELSLEADEALHSVFSAI